ncbi:treslin [Liasis olivaceus]
MTCSHNVVFLLDTADSAEKVLLHLGTLRILNYLGCKFGLAKVRWDFKFFESTEIRGRASQVGRFRELGSRSWEDFEEELEARFGNQLCAPRSPGPVPRATVTQNILKETLLDYQWDRPEIASPTKPVLRSQKNKLTVTLDNPPVHSTHNGFANAIFILSPCPHSQRELWQFISGNYAHLPEELPPSHDLAEKLIPKIIQEMMVNQKVTLYWMDTTEWSKLLESPDHVGYRMLFEVMCVLGGTILPSKVLIQYLDHQKKGTIPASPVECSSSEPSFTPWTKILPFDSSLNCFLSLPSSLQVSFPNLDGVLLLKADGKEEAWSCAVVLEPLTLNQRHLESTVNIHLKCTMRDWRAVHVRNLHTESWILQSKPLGPSAQEISLFQHFVKYLLAQGLHMVAEVSFSSGADSPCTGIFSPISGTAALLSLLFAGQVAEAERSLLQTSAAENFSKDEDFCLPEIVSNVLSQAVDDSDEGHQASPETLGPEWAQQELSRTHRWSTAVLEDWYTVSNLCGASSHLMESFRMLQANSTKEEEETPKPEMELMQSLAEFYQKKISKHTVSSHPQDQKRRCGVPRTPIRQKMKTMPRSLQMLNVAMLNVKAQKYQPDGDLPVNKKPCQRLPSRRLDDKGEEKGRKSRIKIDFSTEDKMLSYITTNYQKAMMDGENLFACSQDMVTAVNTFQKSNEAACLDTIQGSLLKATSTLRQQLATDPEKETRIKECQLQVYLRLEMCLQCPSLPNSTDRMEQLVEEMTELLRMLCLSKDPGYLTRFLEEVVDIYMESMPKTLGDLYYSLGTEIPPKLASVLPVDFFSDDSITQEAQMPSLPASAASVPLSKTGSLSTEADELEELRTRSAKKRKHPLARHRSITEVSQNLRQIEIPQASRNHRRKDRSHVPFDVKLAPISKKMGVQEVTKVRRNLFNEETLPLSKSSLPKIARSQSVSILEDLKDKPSRSNEDIRAHHKLLTKRVAETPLHKQISKRLLHRQITGRCSDPGSDVVGIVEESPEKIITCSLRRSPRIKQLMQDKFLSNSFHSLEPNKKKTPQVHSVHLEEPGLASPPVKATQSPKSILFGEVLDGFCLGRMGSPQTRRKQLIFDEPVPQAPGKTYSQSFQELLNPSSSMLRRSPRIQEKAQRAPPKTPALKNSVAKCLGNLFSPSRQKSKSLSESTENKESRLSQITERKGRYPSPSKAAELQTPQKQPLPEMLDDVFALPADGPNSPIILSAPPSPFSVQGKSRSELQSPRRSLRIAQKTAPTALAENRTFEIRQNTCPEPFLSVEVNSLLSDASSATFKDMHPELGLSPNIRTLTETSSEIHSAFQSDGLSPPCNGPAKAVSPCTFSPTREKLGRKSCTPQETQSIRKTSPIKALSSPPCLPEEEYPCMNSRSLFPKTSPFFKPGNTEAISLDQRSEQIAKIISPSKKRDLERCLPPAFSSNNPTHIAHAIVMCEQLDVSPLLNKSLSESSHVDQGPKVSQSTISSVEKGVGFQPLLFSSPPGHDQASLLGISKSGSCAYALRCTPDRRQREAAARFEKAEKMAISGTVGATAPPSTYEVELEMQASGLPKLRIKKVASEAGGEQQPLVPEKLKGEENDRTMGDLSVAWCSRHSEKLEPVSISPSCVRSAHNTPGKFGIGGQTYICQSYSPTLCTSSTTSPSQGSIGIPWTPSPKHKGKVTPEAIKDWPRRKRAAVGCNRSERPAEAVGEEPAPCTGGREALELFSSRKVQHLGEPELEGIYKLQDQSLGSDTEGSKDENICRNTVGLESRKRALEQTPLEEEASQEMKRPCLIKENPEAAVYSTKLLSVGEQTVSSKSMILEDIFSFSDMTPPKSSGKGAISASGLWALEQSPLLYKGHPASLRKCPKGEDSDTFGAANEDVSLFRSTAARKQSNSKTYSRKRPLC